MAPRASRPTSGRPAHRKSLAEADKEAELARYYDLDTLGERADVAMYLELARGIEGPILELACGTGRICIPLANAGHRVVGVDNDPHMLERARQAWLHAQGASKRGSLDLVEADLMSYRSDQRFDLIILAFNSLMLMRGRDAQIAALRAMAEHLSPGGRAVIDVWLPTSDDLAIYDGRTTLEWVRTETEAGGGGPARVAKSTSAVYDPTAMTAAIDTFFDVTEDGEPVRRIHRRDEVTFISPPQLLEMAERAGLEREAVHGDHAFGPFHDQSDRLILVCRRSGL